MNRIDEEKKADLLRAAAWAFAAAVGRDQAQKFVARLVKEISEAQWDKA